MANAKDVQVGAVYKARVSGKVANVEILGPAAPTESGRKRFRYKNLATGREAKGTAGKLFELVSPAPAEPTPAPTFSPTPYVSPAVQSWASAIDGSGMPQRRPIEPASEYRRRIEGMGYTNPHVGDPGFQFPVQGAPRPHPEQNPMAAQSMPQHMQGPPGLASLRGRGAPRQNPSHYPSRAAKQAAKAISNSNAQTPAEVLAVVQQWAQQSAGGRPHYAQYGFAGAGAGYANPYGQPHQSYPPMQNMHQAPMGYPPGRPPWGGM